MSGPGTAVASSILRSPLLEGLAPPDLHIVISAASNSSSVPIQLL